MAGRERAGMCAGTRSRCPPTTSTACGRCGTRWAPTSTAGEYGYDLYYFRRTVRGAGGGLPAGRRIAVWRRHRMAARRRGRGRPQSGRSPGIARPICTCTPPRRHPNFRHLEWFHDHVRIEQMFFDGTAQPVGGEIRLDPGAVGNGLALRDRRHRAIPDPLTRPGVPMTSTHEHSARTSLPYDALAEALRDHVDGEVRFDPGLARRTRPTRRTTARSPSAWSSRGRWTRRRTPSPSAAITTCRCCPGAAEPAWPVSAATPRVVIDWSKYCTRVHSVDPRGPHGDRGNGHQTRRTQQGAAARTS